MTRELVGAAILVIELTAVLATAVRIACRIAPGADEALERALLVLFGALVDVVVTLQLLGMLGLLHQGTVLALQVAVAAAVLRFVRPAPPVGIGRRPPLLTLTGSAVALWFGFVAAFLARGISGQVETVRYHLPNAAFWLRRGTLWPLPYVQPGLLTNTGPSNGELIGVWLLLPTHDDRIVYGAPVLFGAVIVLAVALAVRELGGSAGVGALASVAVLAAPMFWLTQVDALLADLPAGAGFATGVAFALVARTRQGDARWVWASAVAFGFGIGSKYPVLIPSLGGLGLLVTVVPRAARRRTAIIAVAGVAALSGFWFLRNLVATGNPLYPKGVSVGGRTLFEEGRTPISYLDNSMLDQLRDGNSEVLRGWADAVRLVYGPCLFLFAVAVVALGWRAVSRRDRTSVGLSFLAALAALAYLAHPYTGGGADGLLVVIGAQIRYTLPLAIVLAIAVGGMAPAVVGGVVAGVAVAWDASKLMRAPAFRLDLDPSFLMAAAAVVAAGGAVAFAVFVLPKAYEYIRSRRARSPGGFLPGAAGLLAVAIVVGAGALHALAPASAPDPVAAALRRSGDPDGKVLLVGVDNVRGTLGPRLDHDAVTIGTGPAHSEPVLDPAELDRRLEALDPAVVIVGKSTFDRPPDWTPTGWEVVATIPSGDVYIRA